LEALDFKMNFFFVILSASLIVFSQFRNIMQNTNLKRELISPPAYLEFFSFGYQMPVADSLWLRAIQDFDYCEKKNGENECIGNGWLSRTLDAVTNLAPDYLIAYRAGGLALTIVISDYPGASKIFDKGVKLFPNDRKLLYSAAYHAMIEEKNYEKAGYLFAQAARNGAPDWAYSLAVSLYTKAGRNELGQKLYQELYQTEIDEKILERIKSKLNSQQ
jgi:hypothetical protein